MTSRRKVFRRRISHRIELSRGLGHLPLDGDVALNARGVNVHFGPEVDIQEERHPLVGVDDVRAR